LFPTHYVTKKYHVCGKKKRLSPLVMLLTEKQGSM
jgi:hypothetical protein